jgi:hypothetical protein
MANARKDVRIQFLGTEEQKTALEELARRIPPGRGRPTLGSVLRAAIDEYISRHAPDLAPAAGRSPRRSKR